MSDNWYYSRGGQQYGPYTPVQLRQLADAGQLLPSDQLWSEGMGVWIEASKASLLFAPQQAPPAATPMGPAAGAAPMSAASTAPSQLSMGSSPGGVVPQQPLSPHQASTQAMSPQQPSPQQPSPQQPSPSAAPAHPAANGPVPGQPGTNGLASNGPAAPAGKPGQPARPLKTGNDDNSIDPKVMIGTAAVVVPILIISLAVAFWPKGETEVVQEMPPPETTTETADDRTSDPFQQPPITVDTAPGLEPIPRTRPPEPVVPKKEPPPVVEPEPNPPAEPAPAEPKTTEPPPKTEPKSTQPPPAEPKTTDVPPKTVEEPKPPASEPPPADIAAALADHRLFGTVYEKTLLQLARETPDALGAELLVSRDTIELACEDLFTYIGVKDALLKLAKMDELRLDPPKNIGGYVTDVALKLPQPVLPAELDERRVMEILGPPTGERAVSWKVAGEDKTPVTYVTWYDGLLGYANGSFWLNGPKVIEAVAAKKSE